MLGVNACGGALVWTEFVVSWAACLAASCVLALCQAVSVLACMRQVYNWPSSPVCQLQIDMGAVCTGGCLPGGQFVWELGLFWTGVPASAQACLRFWGDEW